MSNAIKNRNIEEVERTYAVEACDIHPIFPLIGSTLVMRVNPATRAEEMLRGTGIESIVCEHVFASQKADPAYLRRNRDGTAHPAIGAGASTDRVESVAECHLEANCAAMALACPTI
jgi:hypothetical protein